MEQPSSFDLRGKRVYVAGHNGLVGSAIARRLSSEGCEIPWPVGGLDTIWAATGTIQRRGNVWLVQNALPCTPCQLEGCERRLDSYSQCLDELSPGQVIAAADQALAAAKR